MAIKVIVELQAKPGRRGELESLLASIVATHGPSQRGFLGSTRYEVLDNPDRLIEVVEWESAEARTLHIEESAKPRTRTDAGACGRLLQGPDRED